MIVVLLVRDATAVGFLIVSDLGHPQAPESSCRADDLPASQVVTVLALATRLVKVEHLRCR